MARMDRDWDPLPSPGPGDTVIQNDRNYANFTKHQSYPPQLESVEVARVDFLEAHVPDHSAVFHYLVLLQLQVAKYSLSDSRDSTNPTGEQYARQSWSA